jgi:antitoxin MazE
MVTRIQKWGNSLALRIPRAFAREIGLEQGACVEVSLRRGKVVLEPVEEPPLTLEELLEGVTEANLHREVDTGPAVGKEAW